MKYNTILKVVLNAFIFLLVISIGSAQDFYQDSLQKVILKEKNDSKKIDQLLSLSNSYFGENFTLCERYALEAANISKDLKDHSNIAKAYLSAAGATIYKGNIQEGLNYLKEAEVSYLKIKDSLGLAEVLKLRGIIQMNSAKYGPALTSFERASSLFVSKSNKSGEALCQMDIGIIYFYLGDYDKAAEYYYKSLHIAEEIKNKKSIAYAENNIANLFYLQKKHEASIELFIKCLNSGKEMNDKVLIADCEYYLALNYFETNKLNLSLKFCKSAILIDSLQGNYRGLATKNILFANIQKKKKNYKLAKDKIELAYYYAGKTDDSVQVLSNCLIKMGEINLLMGNKRESKSNLYKAIELSKKGKLRQQLYEAYQKISEIFEKEKDLVNALKYHKLYIGHKDSALNEKNNKSINQLEAIYKDEQKKSEIARLNTLSQLQKKNIDLEKERSSNKSQQNIFLIIGLALLLLVLGILYKSSHNKQKQNILLQSQKEAIAKKNAEKEILLKEIHHRVKNNLQVISSLLSLQSNNIKDETALIELKEGQNRVKTIAMIHQKLYQHEDISKVNFHEYCEELLAYLRTTFQIPGKDIMLEVNAQDIQLDIDTAVPLGLIINELVSNCFKYAFEDQIEGKINVGLRYLDESQQKLELQIQDNGKGMPEDIDLKNTSSLGLKLVRMLSMQLDGKVSQHNKNGTIFTVQIANSELRKRSE